MKSAIFALLLLPIFIAMTGVTVGSADRGVGISTGEITVANRLSPGGGYSLPKIGVSNTGDAATSYELALTYLEGQQQRKPAPGWFDFDPQTFTLDAGESREVSVALTIPAGAQPGDYFALLQAKTVSDQRGGTSVGVAAATKLTFSVGSAGWLEAQWLSLNRHLDDAAPWTYIIPGALLLAFLATRARRLPFRLRIERR